MKRMFFFMIVAIFIIAGCSMGYMGHEAGDSGDDSADMTNFDPLLVKSNIAQGKSVTASSTEPGCPAENAVDGNTSTRWSSDFSDPQWISIDLGSSYSIDQVVLHWETAYGKEYKIQVSDDASTWTTIYHETNGNGGIDDLTVSGTGRYVRMYGIARSTQYGYSLWEFEINEEGSSSSSSGTNIAQGKSVTASSTEPGCPAENAVDGNTGTRWASDFSDPQWIYVDLGNSDSINRVVLNWETAYGKEYKIQVSDNALTWTTIYHETNSNGGIDDLSVSGTGRYVRMYGIARGTEWGYSLWEFEVYEVANVLKNPDFEASLSYWSTWTYSDCCTMGTTQSVFNSGIRALYINFSCYDLSYTTETALVYQEISPVMNSGDTVIFTMRSRTAEGSWMSPGQCLELEFLDTQNNVIESFQSLVMKISASVPAGAVKIKVYCKCWRVRRFKAQAYFDNGRVSVIPQ